MALELSKGSREFEGHNIKCVLLYGAMNQIMSIATGGINKSTAMTEIHSKSNRHCQVLLEWAGLIVQQKISCACVPKVYYFPT